MYTLLIIDDNPEYRNALVDLLSRQFTGISILECSRCAEIIPIIKQATPDAVILDVNLPDGNGLSAIQDIKNINPETRIIVVSCADYPEYRTAARSLGADMFLSKTATTPNQCMEMVTRIMQPSTESPASQKAPILM